MVETNDLVSARSIRDHERIIKNGQGWNVRRKEGMTGDRERREGRVREMTEGTLGNLLRVLTEPQFLEARSLQKRYFTVTNDLFRTLEKRTHTAYQS